MKNIFISITCSFVLFLSAAQTTTAANTENESLAADNDKVTAKCHLVLIDGNEGIFFWRLSPKRFSNMSEWVVGRKVLPENSIEQVQVYKVHECVLEENEFTAVKAQLLDEKTLK